MLKQLIPPVTHLRREPIPFSGIWKDPLQETQLLCGEQVKVVKEEGEWSYVHAVEQQKFDSAKKEWMGYPGWVKTEALGEVSDIVKNNFKKKSPVEAIRLYEVSRPLIGTPYLWGGASFHDPADPEGTGVDCSGLVYLLHRIHGIFLPRDAHDQWLKCRPIEGEAVEPGDLIFIELNEKKGRMDHVMLYLGDEILIEAVIRPGHVREISFDERIGLSRQECKNLQVTKENQTFYFGKIVL